MAFALGGVCAWQYYEARGSLQTLIGALRVAVSPDGQWLALSAAPKLVAVYRLSDGVEYQRFTGPTHLRSQGLEFSLDSTQLLSAYDGFGFVNTPNIVPATIPVWTVATGRPVFEPQVKHGMIGQATFVSDHELAVVARHQLVEWDLTQRAISNTRTIPERTGSRLVATPDGRRVVYGPISNGSAEITAYDVTAGRMLLDEPRALASIKDARLSRDGRYLAVGGTNGGRGSLRVWDLTNVDELTVSAPPRGDVLAVELSSDGSSLAAVDSAGYLRLWKHQQDRWEAAQQWPLDGVFYRLAMNDNGTIVAVSTDRSVTAYWADGSRQQTVWSTLPRLARQLFRAGSWGLLLLGGVLAIVGWRELLERSR